jgi:hypothetical protein
VNGEESGSQDWLCWQGHLSVVVVLSIDERLFPKVVDPLMNLYKERRVSEHGLKMENAQPSRQTFHQFPPNESSRYSVFVKRIIFQNILGNSQLRLTIFGVVLS